jgi:peptidoglycan hydrolase FlgJ
VSISPVSDIVLDVAMAADPAKSRAATEKLSSGETVSQVQSGTFESTLKNTVARMPDAWKNHGTPSLAAAGVLHQTNASTRAYKGLEQLVLKNLVESMLPKESPTLFGSGTAGDIWRSMLADQLACNISNVVDLGSARRQSIGTRSAAHAQDANTQLLLPPPPESRMRNET